MTDCGEIVCGRLVSDDCWVEIIWLGTGAAFEERRSISVHGVSVASS